MKVEIKTDKLGYCEYFKIDGKEYGKGIYELNIKIIPTQLPEIIIKCNSNEFIMASDDTKLYIDNLNKEE